MTKPRLPGAHEAPTPSDEGEPFVVLLVGNGYEEGERMTSADDATIRRELSILLDAFAAVDARRAQTAQALRQAVKDSLRGMN